MVMISFIHEIPKINFMDEIVMITLLKKMIIILLNGIVITLVNMMVIVAPLHHVQKMVMITLM